MPKCDDLRMVSLMPRLYDKQQIFFVFANPPTWTAASAAHLGLPLGATIMSGCEVGVGLFPVYASNETARCIAETAAGAIVAATGVVVWGMTSEPIGTTEMRPVSDWGLHLTNIEVLHTGQSALEY